MKEDETKITYLPSYRIGFYLGVKEGSQIYDGQDKVCIPSFFLVKTLLK